MEKKSTFYAIQVTRGIEAKVALLLYNRAYGMNLDVRSIAVPPEIKGYIIIEVGDPGALYYLMKGLRHIKRKRPILIGEEDALKMIKPVVEVPKISKGQTVEIIGGPFKGMKGKVMEVYEARKEADITLLESDYRMVVTISIELLKPVS